MKKVFTALVTFLLVMCLFRVTAQDRSDNLEIAFFATYHYSNRVDHPGLYTTNLDGTDRWLVVSEDRLLEGLVGNSIWEITLSPNSKKIAYNTFSNKDGLVIYDLQTDEITRLKHGFAPSWSADSQHLAFVSIVNTDAEFLTYEVIVFDVASNQQSTIWATDDTSLEPGSNTVYLWDFAWSPDAQSLVASIEQVPRVHNASTDTGTDSVTGSILLTFSTVGSDLQQINVPDDLIVYNPVWVEEYIYFICYRQAYAPPTSICQFDLTTSETNIFGDFTDILPSGEWISDFDILPDGRLIFSRSYYNIEGLGGDIYYADLSSGTITNIDESSDAMNILVRWIKPENQDQ